MIKLKCKKCKCKFDKKVLKKKKVKGNKSFYVCSKCGSTDLDICGWKRVNKEVVMVKRTKSIRAVEALEAVKERIENEVAELDVEVNKSGKDVRGTILEIIDEQLEKES